MRKATYQESGWLRIGELAELLQTTTKTIRFYESRGLLPEAVRTSAGYRSYAEPAVRQAQLVVGLRRLGLSIEELQHMVSASGARSRRRQLIAVIDEKLRQQDLELSVLQGRRDDLAARLEALLLTPGDRPPGCVCDALLIPCRCADGANELP